MNLFEFVSTMKELNSTVALVGIVLLALFLVVIIFKMLFGMRRGFWRQLVRTAMTVVSAVVSYIAASTLSNKIMGSGNQQAVEDLLVELDGVAPETGDFIREFLNSFEPEIFESILLLPATIILIPIIATVLFLLINLVLKIVRAIIIKVLHINKAKNNTHRLGGVLLAAVEAIIWLAMVTLPITGLLSLVEKGYDAAKDSALVEDNAELERIHSEYLAPFSENPAFTFIGSVGAGAMSDGIATVEIHGQKVNMREEVVSITGIIMSEATSLKELDIANLTEENKGAIESILDGVCDSPYLTTVISGVLRSAGVLFDHDVIKLDKGGQFGDILNGFIDYLQQITDDTLSEDLNTIKDLVFTICDSGAISAIKDGDSDLWTVLQEKNENGEDVVKKIVGILQSNERTAGFVKIITQALIASLTNIETPSGETVTYDDLKNGMNNVLAVDKESFETEEEYKQELTNTLDTTLKDNGIELEEEIVSGIADYIDENYSDQSNLTDEEFNDVLLSYYDVYLKYINGEEIDPDELPDGFNPDDFNGDNAPGANDNSGQGGSNPDDGNNSGNPDGGNGNIDINELMSRYPDFIIPAAEWDSLSPDVQAQLQGLGYVRGE